MQTVIKNPRNGCGLHGAIQTVEEIKGVVPIVHSNAGCTIQNYLANKASGLGNGYVSGYSIPGTDAQERHVIFGGASRLREQIKNTIKVVNGDLYIVLNSCESAMVGDDIAAMTKESVEQGESVIDCLIAGFHGDSHYGYENVVTDIIKKLSTVRKIEVEKDERLVNIFGILPQKDIYFKGDLAEIKRILEGIGLKVNTFFGPENGVKEFEIAQNAALNIVFSKWGVKPAEKLEELYDVPKLVFASIPTGIQEVKEFVGKVAEALNLEEEKVNAFLKKEEATFRYYFQGIVDDFYEEQAGRKIALVGDESTVLRVGRFAKNYLGAIVDVAVITDGFPGEDGKIKKSEELKALANEIYFTQDGKEIDNILVHSDVELILGSSLEDEAAKKKETLNLEISYPVYHKAIVNKTYAGVNGALTFTEDYITKVKESNRFAEERLLNRIKA